MRWFPLSCLFPALLSVPAVAAGPVEILVLYDNTSTRPDAAADWGFSALITSGEERVLFDSGAKPSLLLANMKTLGVDPRTISRAVISHEHSDHINGIYQVFALNKAMKVWFLDAFPPKAFSEAEVAGMKPVRVTAPVEIAPGIHTTGLIEGTPPEQALVIETARGLVVITGCSHPGVVKMVEAAKRQRGATSIRLLVGGFHMHQQSEAEAAGNIAHVKALGVVSVAPTHCTGELAARLFAKAYGSQALTAGVGRKFVLD